MDEVCAYEDQGWEDRVLLGGTSTGDSPRDKLLELYSGLGIYTRFYVKVRCWLLQLERYAEFVPPDGVLVDIGCGQGVLANYLSLRFPGSQVIGIDSNPKRIEVALKTVGERGNINFLLKDARGWALPSCTGVVMTDFLHHLSRQDQELILQKAFDSLEKGGRLVILESDPTAKPIYGYWLSYLSDRFLYPFSKICFRKPYEWENTLSHLGFDVKTIKMKYLIFSPVLYVCQK